MANISQVKLPSGVTYPLKAPVIPYGTVDSTSTSTAFTATVDGITELTDGTIMMLHNGVVTSAAGFTININGLGAKEVYNNLTNATQDTTIFNIAYTMIFVYSTALDSGNGGWWCYRGYDSNTNTIGYQLRGNSGTRPATDKGYRYRLWLTSADDQGWVPINISTSTNATTARTLNTRAIDPFGEIVYNSLNGTTNAGDNVSATTTWQQYTCNLGYSYVKTLTAYDPVYLKCTPQTTGGAVMNDIVQKLPTTKDGFIYIYLGIAYSTTSMELRFYHPVYYHDGTGVRVWTGKETSMVSYSQNVISGTKIGTITIDGTGTDIYAPSAGGGGTITAVKTTAGAHTTINVTSGNAEFNVPTKTSHLADDVGFLTSETDPIFSASAASGITSTDITNWNNKVSDDKTWNGVSLNKASVSSAGSDILIPYLTSTSDTQADLIYGRDSAALAYTIPLRNSNGYIVAATPTSGDDSTKVATTAFVNTAIGAITIPSITLNGSSTTSPSFYAPTTAGTSGYVLKSNGSGAPTWTSAELTDTKVTVAAAADGTTYYPILATGAGTETRQYDTALMYYPSSTNAWLQLGNSSKAALLTFVKGNYFSGITPTTLTENRNLVLPDASGTVALTSDITTATLSATDDGAGNVTLLVSGVTSANLNSASGVSF